MSSISYFKTSVVLAGHDLATNGRSITPEIAMDAVELAIAAIPGVEGIDITYLGARRPAGPWVTVSPCRGEEANDQLIEDQVQTLRNRVAGAARRALDGLSDLRGRDLDVMHAA